MVYTLCNYDEISLLLKKSEKKFEYYVIPYILCKIDENNYSYFIFMKNYLNETLDILSSKIYSCDEEYIFSDQIQNEIVNSTNGSITFYDKENSKYFVPISENSLGEKYISDKMPILVLALIPGANGNYFNKIELKHILMQFRESLSYKMRSFDSDFTYDGNLVFISDVELYDVCLGEKHYYEDPDGQLYSRDVSEGILFDKDIIDIYKCKEGEIPYKYR